MFSICISNKEKEYFPNRVNAAAKKRESVKVREINFE
jgi:hypothetical protein